jgi:ADP-ribose pyrophosphatase YjhB (NUDIX family)
MFIQEKTYKTITSLMPVPAIEAVIINSKNDLLVLKRNNPPAKGEWWFPGGRIRRGETFFQTLTREVKEETGLDVKVLGFIGVYERIFRERHDIPIVFLCRCEDENVILNSEHSEYKFLNANKAFAELHQMLKEVLADMFGKKLVEF